MKFRCPYCRQIMDRVERGLCPNCSKTVRLPHTPEKAEYVPRAKRVPSLVEKRDPIPFMSLFARRPTFIILVAGVAVVFIAVLFSVKYDSGEPRRILTKEARTSEELGLLRTSLEWFRQTIGRYPTTEEGLDVLMGNRAPGWDQPFINDVPYDLWGSPFQYSSSNDTVRLFSRGPDRTPGTGDDIPAPGPDYKLVMRNRSLGITTTN